jgi:hypothetical protein
MNWFRKPSWVLIVPLLLFVPLLCDLWADESSNVKLSFDISFLRGWKGYVNKKSNAAASFYFPGESADIVIHGGTKNLTDIAVRTDDMLHLPLLGGKTYRLNLTVLASKGCTIVSKYEPIPASVERKLTEPESCRFTLEEGLNELTCQFTAAATTESDLYSLYIGDVQSDTRITIQKMKLHMLK